MTSLTATEASHSFLTTAPLVIPPTLVTTAPALMAYQSKILNCGPLRLTHYGLNLLQPALRPNLQLNLPFPSSSSHIIQILTTQQAHKLPNIISQHIMVPHHFHLLIRSVLQNHQSPLLELGGDIHHCLYLLVKVLKLPHQLMNLNSQ